MKVKLPDVYDRAVVVKPMIGDREYFSSRWAQHLNLDCLQLLALDREQLACTYALQAFVHNGPQTKEHPSSRMGWKR